ncbi:uncharacterized protein LOC131241115 [Magnolia sinica]|uniref:uncharacterized protein LOC131241115 n=1 Tax=Magnolia sinica TaxID=86752 RepID=UPI0026590E60|nr:uncharacterized protein LOC131241115 [Magnolia sinica]
MLLLQQQSLHFPFPPLSHRSLFSPSFRPTTTITTFHHSFRARLQTGPETLLAQLPEPPSTSQDEDGPIELPPPSSSSSPLFGNPNDPSPLQVATSVLLTGAISVFLFRSLRRRARRAKEMKFRSSGMEKKGLKDEALDSLKAMQSVSIEPGSPPSPVQALLGGLSAGVIALVLYKFTTTIEAALNRQTISDNLSVRQITITIRTIVNGLCYLATFVFGINGVGLVLYSGQLAINSFMETSADDATSSKGSQQPSTTSASTTPPMDDMRSNGDGEQQGSDGTQ